MGPALEDALAEARGLGVFALGAGAGDAGTLGRIVGLESRIKDYLEQFDRELAELRQCGLVDRAPVNQRMLEMGKKGLAVQLAKKAAGVASMAKSLSKEEA